MTVNGPDILAANRLDVLTALANCETADLPTLKSALITIAWDSQEELTQVRPTGIARALTLFLAGTWSSAELEDWANLLESREDIGFDNATEDWTRSALHELANPALEGRLTTTRAQALLSTAPVAPGGASLRSEIERYIQQLLDLDDNRLDWLKPTVKREQLLPLYLAWLAAPCLRVDGSVVLWRYEDDPPTITPLRYGQTYRTGICEASKKYPLLRILLPPPPLDAVRCSACLGSGVVSKERPHLIRNCGGTGWTVPTEAPEDAI